jgi:hypothetical protein
MGDWPRAIGMHNFSFFAPGVVVEGGKFPCI